MEKLEVFIEDFLLLIKKNLRICSKDDISFKWIDVIEKTIIDIKKIYKVDMDFWYVVELLEVAKLINYNESNCTN